MYGDEKYGNILLYGEKDKDYKLKDGIAEACDGGSLDDDYLTKLSLNLFRECLSDKEREICGQS